MISEGLLTFTSESLVRVLLYGCLVLALDLQFGYTDMPNFGVTGFFALGAYVTAILTAADPQFGMGFGMPWYAGWIASVVVVTIVGALISLITTRVSDIYLALVTFAFAEIILFATENLQGITGGSFGLINLNQPLGQTEPLVQSAVMLGMVGLVVLPAVIFVSYRIGNSPFGRVLQAIRVDELVARVNGKNTLKFKVLIFSVGSAIMGLIGGLWATFNGGVLPNMFNIRVLLLIWIAMIIGGNRRIRGLLLGTAAIFSIRISSRFVEPPMITDTQYASLRFALIGLLLIIVVIYRPEGLLGEEREVL